MLKVEPRRLSRIVFMAILALLLLPWFAPTDSVAQETVSEQPLVAFTQDGNVWLMSADGSDQRALTDDAEAEAAGDGIFYRWYEWSPDGEYLLIVREQRDMNAGRPTSELLVHDVASGETRTLIDDIGPGAFFPSWALDASQIAFLSADPMTGTGDAYSISSVSLEGEIQPLADIAGSTCNLPSGQPFDPAYDLHFQEFGPFSGMILDRSIFWRSTQQDLWFDILCGPAVYVDLTTGEQTETALDRIVAGPDGRIAGVSRDATAGSSGASIVIATDPAGADQRVLRTGETPVWAMASGDLFFVTTNYGTEFMTLEPADADLESLSLTFNRAALWIAPADGSEPVKLVDRAVYAFGEPSPASDGSFVVLTRIDNSSDLWENRLDGDTYTQALLDEYGPEARIQRYDLGTGELTTLVTNGFRPKMQPRSVDLSRDGSTPVSG